MRRQQRRRQMRPRRLKMVIMRPRGDQSNTNWDCCFLVRRPSTLMTRRTRIQRVEVTSVDSSKQGAMTMPSPTQVTRTKIRIVMITPAVCFEVRPRSSISRRGAVGPSHSSKACQQLHRLSSRSVGIAGAYVNSVFGCSPARKLIIPWCRAKLGQMFVGSHRAAGAGRA